uniref:Uncharacterized protein n=1 Tax=Anguilla anguilla TaxID=7936 RepID=A0A0E9XCI0_ANGAN
MLDPILPTLKITPKRWNT